MWTSPFVLCQKSPLSSGTILGDGYQGFSKWNEPEEKSFGNITAMIYMNRKAHNHLLECLRGCTEDDLLKPIPTRCHGKTAANFFWIMIMHDINHGAQIKTIRRAYGSFSDYSPIRHE
jgi:hypothetical protein